MMSRPMRSATSGSGSSSMSPSLGAGGSTFPAMTHQLPMGDTPDDDEMLDDPWHDQIVEVTYNFGAPDVPADVAFVLSVVSLLGYGLLSGGVYFFFSTPSGDESFKTRNILAALLGAAFALLPVVLG